MIGASFQITNSDKIIKQVAKAIKEKMPNGEVQVGVFEDESKEAAFVAEFGAPNVPPSPFITAATEQNKRKYRQIVIENYPLVMADRMKINDVMGLIGKEAVSDIRQYMVELKEPRNSDVTIQIKGFDDRLITNDNKLYKAIDFEVIE